MTKPVLRYELLKLGKQVFLLLILFCQTSTFMAAREDSLYPVNTRRYLDVDSKSYESYGRQMDVKTTLVENIYNTEILTKIIRAFLKKKYLSVSIQ